MANFRLRNRFFSSAARFGQDRRGQIAVTFAVSLLPAMTLVGAAVDYSRLLSLKSNLQAATDGAILASANQMTAQTTTSQLQTMAQSFLRTQIGTSNGYVGVPSVTSATISTDRYTICANSQETVSLPMMQLVRAGSITVNAYSCAGLAGQTTTSARYEIAIAIDNSGSMNETVGGATKLSLVKTAAKAMVNALNPGSGTQQAIVSVVPFTSAVNVGTSFKNSTWIDQNGASSIHWQNYQRPSAASWNPTSRFDLYTQMNATWGGCMEERAPTYLTSDDAPTTSTADTLFVPYLAPDEAGYPTGLAHYQLNNQSSTAGSSPKDTTWTSTQSSGYSGICTGGGGSTTTSTSYACTSTIVNGYYFYGWWVTTSTSTGSSYPVSSASSSCPSDKWITNYTSYQNYANSPSAGVTTTSCSTGSGAFFNGNKFRSWSAGGGSSALSSGYGNSTWTGHGASATSNLRTSTSTSTSSTWPGNLNASNSGNGATYTSYNSYLDDDGGTCDDGDAYAVADVNDTISQGSGATKVCKYKGVTAPTTVASGFGSAWPAGPNFMCNARALQTLTTDMTKVTGTSGIIDAMTAKGDTNVLSGLMWAWRTISPNGPFTVARNSSNISVTGLTDPKAYTATNNNKVIVLLTDGMNHWSDNPKSPYKSAYSALGYYVNNRVAAFDTNGSGTTTSSNYRAEMDAAVLSACTNAKNAGVTIYTVGFSISSDPIDAAGQSMLQSCATTGKYFLATDSATLTAAFSNIASNLTKLRLTQ